MKTFKKSASCFLVIVPHRDIRVRLKKYSDELYKNGLKNVYDFPRVAPVASLFMPLSPDELKHIAYSLRKAAGENKITAEKTALTSFKYKSVTEETEEDLLLIGHEINIPIPDGIFNTCKKKIKSLFSPAIIGTCLMPKTKERHAPLPQTGGLPAVEPIPSFRAAAIANMYWLPIQENNETAFKWKIDKLVWLPKQIKN